MSGAVDRRIEEGRFVAMLTHLNAGWRYWAFASGRHPNRLPDRSNSDAFWGLDPNGYATEGEAREAMRKAESEADARIANGCGECGQPLHFHETTLSMVCLNRRCSRTVLEPSP